MTSTLTRSRSNCSNPLVDTSARIGSSCRIASVGRKEVQYLSLLVLLFTIVVLTGGIMHHQKLF